MSSFWKIWIVGMVWLSCAIAQAQPARIIVIRHAEKPENEADVHLSPEGRARAEGLVQWLTTGKILGTNGTPVALYAAASSKNGRSIRCVETMEPTAKQLKLTLQTPVRAEDYGRLAHEILINERLRGKTIVICWTHDFLPQLAASLGVKTEIPKWKSGDFSSAYLITINGNKSELKVMKQKLPKS